jgi:ADP-dependent NAD(P)H-hydrate dehydratase / NAD(P)H-hydrate epimerase
VRVIPVVTPEEMRAIDAAAPEPVEVLIERAGAAVARAGLRVLGGAYGRTVVVLAGPGHNGADGRVAADRLRERGVSVRVYDALDLPPVLPRCDMVIDAAFGTGFRGAWRAPVVETGIVLAVDLPTGLDGLTGHAPPTVLSADVTVTFQAAKPGHVLLDGPDVTGELVVADIGLDVGSASMGLVERADVAAWLPDRPRTAHKWRSAVRIVAGSPGMTGAAHLSARAAQRAGSGMVVVSTPGLDTAALHATAPVEAVGRAIPITGWDEAVLADLHRFESLVIGPGLGRADFTVPSIVRTVTRAPVPAVVDGDGLFAMSWNDAGTPAFLRDRAEATVLTPHDGEYALLTGSAPGVDRVAAARHLVELSGAVVLLKGPTTVVAEPSGRVWFVDEGDQRLATAGTGDVLAGIIGALLATGLDAGRASAAGAWLHAHAGSLLPARGLVAGDLVDVLPEVLEACRR